MEERRKADRRKGGLPGGLHANPEDLQWLRLVDLNSTEFIPGFNKSRLVALGLIENVDGKPQLTDRGRLALKPL